MIQPMVTNDPYRHYIYHIFFPEIWTENKVSNSNLPISFHKFKFTKSLVLGHNGIHLKSQTSLIFPGLFRSLSWGGIEGSF